MTTIKTKIVVITLLRFGSLSLKNAYFNATSLFGLFHKKWKRATKAPSYSFPSFKKLNDFQSNSSQTFVAINKEMAETIPYPA